MTTVVTFSWPSLLTPSPYHATSPTQLLLLCFPPFRVLNTSNLGCQIGVGTGKPCTNLVTMETFIVILGVFFFILSYKMWSLNSNCFVFPSVHPVCPLHFAFSLLPPLGLPYPLILHSRRSRHALSPSHHAYLSCGAFTACHCLNEWPWTWWSCWTTAFFGKALSSWRIPSHMP